MYFVAERYHRAEEPKASPDINKVQKMAEAPKEMDIAVYYVKSSDSDAYLVREIHRVPYTEDGPRAAVNELIGGNPKTPGAARVLPPGTRILGAKINDGLATVNFSKEVLNANVGSAGEALGIQSIVNTLTEFPNIKEVSFQVEGKAEGRAMDWWGHVGLYEQPFKRRLEKVHHPAIWVTHPVAGQVSGVPLLVKGSARVFEGRVNARLIDESGKKVAEGSAAATRGAPERGDFEIKITYTPPGKGKGTLEVFWISPRDGSPQDVVKIPIQWP
ncbi:MAG: Gmad2 immunoglobulin-like domain-containing protein [Bacillota bacterium]